MASAPTVATYTNDPANKPLDRVRLEIGDTDCRTAYLSDAEIRFFLEDEADNALRAASRAADAIAAKLARRIDYSHGSVKKSASQLFEQFRKLAKELARKASTDTAAPVATGVTIAEKESADEDASRVQPAFKKGMHDNPRSGPVVTSDPNATTPV